VSTSAPSGDAAFGGALNAALEPAAPELVGQRARRDSPDGDGLLRRLRCGRALMLSKMPCLPPGREREQLLLERGAPAPLGVCLRPCASERGRKVLHVGAGGVCELR
jgi:hypothetical protein